MLITAAIFAAGMYGTLQIKVDFEPVAVLPPKSQLKLFVDEMTVRYPTNGFGAFVYTGMKDMTLVTVPGFNISCTQNADRSGGKQCPQHGKRKESISDIWCIQCHVNYMRLETPKNC